MSLPWTYVVLVQAIAALVIFVIGYLALLLSILTCLGTGVLVYKGARLLWSYMVTNAVSAHCLPTKVLGNVRLARCTVVSMSHPIATTGRHGP